MNPEPTIEIQTDNESDTGYIRLSADKVVSTEQLTDLVLVDLNEYNVAVGIEVLSLAAKIPFGQLNRNFHVDSRTVDILREIQPTLGRFITNVTTGADSTVVDGADAPHGRRRYLEDA
ncbi:DUF2283 domain-containing protein [Brachybacterium squillarum]|uniref:DUF2283 domain-containing protein n=1 Tax=Brachybacterium squillarum TaxID=661979 RepID=UPI0022216135|nr:DUF2283 domain-containing protein [Brachybacterium squillarum]MCW1803888.1 DUF2283 domain-containing protein [Brachybacterium squillarum]